MINLLKLNCLIRMFSFQIRGDTIRQASKRFVFRGNGKVPCVAQTPSTKPRANAVSDGRFKICNPFAHCIFGPSQAPTEDSSYLTEKPGRIQKRQSKVQLRREHQPTLTAHSSTNLCTVTAGSLLASTKKSYYWRKPVLIFVLDRKMNSG